MASAQNTDYENFQYEAPLFQPSYDYSYDPSYYAYDFLPSPTFEIPASNGYYVNGVFYPYPTASTANGIPTFEPSPEIVENSK
mmetsp:Transcript_77585/g.116654  ORF Transcript_77585/g.116654 Transcript_77585/m.116654 type:complete len:83 (+) Transcript_77585:575-823(+)